MDSPLPNWVYLWGCHRLQKHNLPGRNPKVSVEKWKIATTTIPLESRFSLLLPNSWNIGFHPPNLIRFYLLFGFFPMLYNQMCHMYNLRFQIEQQFKILPFEMIRCKKLGEPDSQRMTKQEWIMLQTWYEPAKHVKVFIQIDDSILWSFSNIIAFRPNPYWAVLTSGQTPEPGVHFLLDVLISWADGGSCAHECVS